MEQKVIVGKVDREFINKYIEDNSWHSVAMSWSENLFPLDMPTEVQHRIKWTLAQLDKTKTIIDIGSNKGHMFYGWDRSKITSVDIDDYDIPNFVRADASKLPFEDKKFDQAVLGEIVEHCPDPIAVMKEAMRVSKKLIITVPYEYEWGSVNLPFSTIEEELKRKGKTRKELATEGNETAKDIYSEDNYEHLYHLRYYTPETFKIDLEKAGIKNYKITKIRHQDWCWLGAICE